MKTPPEQFDVILPAGGRITGEFAQMAGVEIKALIDFDGETILRRTIHTLRATDRVGRIVVIGPQAALNEAQKAGANGLIIEGESGPDNILRGVRWLQEGKRKREKDKGDSSFSLFPRADRHDGFAVSDSRRAERIFGCLPAGRGSRDSHSHASGNSRRVFPAHKTNTCV